MNRRIKLYFVTLLFMCGWTQVYAEYPGGYIGFGVHFGTDKTVGAQMSYGVAVSSVGDPGVGPYLFPGIAFGFRKSFSLGLSYYYSDLQLTYFNGAWAGVGVGKSFSDSGGSLRAKIYGGFFMACLTYETPLRVVKDEIPTFVGGYLGLAYPLIGNHLMP